MAAKDGIMNKLISACYIVKNEEKNLARSLASLNRQYDELIVVDTGSTDNTVMVAKKYGAKVYKYRWCDDFAAARNFAIAKVSGDWIIFLDADEYFVEKNIVLKKYVKTAELQNCEAISFPLHNIDNGLEIESSRVIRIWRSKENRHFLGKVHEVVVDAGNRPLWPIFKVEDVNLYHIGYERNNVVAKARRNLLILEKEKQNGRATQLFPRYLAECYLTLGDYYSAMENVLQAIALEPPTIATKFVLYNILYNCLDKLAVNNDKQKILLKNTLELYQKNTEFKYADNIEQDKEHWLFFLQWAISAGAIDVYVAVNDILYKKYNRPKNKGAVLAKKLLQKPNTDSFYVLFKNMVDDICDLFYFLLLSDDENAIKYSLNLPLAMSRIIKCFHGCEEKINENDFDAYIIGLKRLRNLPVAIIDKYISLAESFSYTHQLKVADILLEQECYRAAMLLYQKMPNCIVGDNADFWCNVGICLYFMHNKEAINALQRAAALGSKKRSVAVYLQWLQEENGNVENFSVCDSKE